MVLVSNIAALSSLKANFFRLGRTIYLGGDLGCDQRALDSKRDVPRARGVGVR